MTIDLPDKKRRSAKKPSKDELLAENLLLKKKLAVYEAILQQNERQDVSDQSHAQLFTQLAEVIPQLVWTADADGYTDYFNQVWYEFTGLSHRESEGWGWEHILHPDDLEFCLQRWQHSTTTGEPYEIEYRLRRADGVYRWHIGRARPLRNEKGEIVRWFGTCTDIDNQKQVQIMLQSVMDNISQSIFWKDRNSVFLGCNKLFAQQAGFANPAEIVGKTDYDLPASKEQSDFFRACDRYVMDNDVAEYHIIEPQLQADGKEAWLDTSKIPLHDASGKVVGILGMYEDITEQEKLIAQREDFMASLAHDLKVPLVGALRMLEVILRGTAGSVTPEQARLLKLLHGSHEQLLQMVHNLLQVLRYESDVDELHFAKVDFERLIEDCVSELKPMADEKTVSFDVKLQGSMSIEGDRLAIKRVLQNLLGNAINYSPRNNVVRIHAHDQKPDYVSLDVTNFGGPIAPEDLEHLFQRFWQGTRFGGGTGLGLFLARQVVEGHGGRISCVSTAEEGTTISVLVPKIANPTAIRRPQKSKLSFSK